jgi:hypothetical protein
MLVVENIPVFGYFHHKKMTLAARSAGRLSTANVPLPAHASIIDATTFACCVV